MKKVIGMIAGAGLVTAVAFSATSTTARDGSAPPAVASAVERGTYLVATMGCNDCHTPLKMGPSRT
jgi:uncharacterized membrane protein